MHYLPTHIRTTLTAQFKVPLEELLKWVKRSLKEFNLYPIMDTRVAILAIKTTRTFNKSQNNLKSSIILLKLLLAVSVMNNPKINFH